MFEVATAMGKFSVYLKHDICIFQNTMQGFFPFKNVLNLSNQFFLMIFSQNFFYKSRSYGLLWFFVKTK